MLYSHQQVRPSPIVDTHKVHDSLDLCDKNLTKLPENIGDYQDLTQVRLTLNELTELPKSIGNLSSLIELYVNYNYLICLPEEIERLINLESLYINNNYLVRLPTNIGNLTKLEHLNLSNNKIRFLPDSIGKLANITELDLSSNNLTNLPNTIGQLTNLTHLFLSGNPLLDLSILKNIPNLYYVEFNEVLLPSKYWTKLSDWQPQWLLEEENSQLRQMLISHFGYQKICTDLNIDSIDRWREYDLLKIDNVEQIYDEDGDPLPGSKPIVLLKMICPSTNCIHMIRVPPELESAEVAATWINLGIHPDLFLIES
jgi:Leucine rich repeat